MTLDESIKQFEVLLNDIEALPLTNEAQIRYITKYAIDLGNAVKKEIEAITPTPMPTPEQQKKRKFTYVCYYKDGRYAILNPEGKIIAESQYENHAKEIAETLNAVNWLS